MSADFHIAQADCLEFLAGIEDESIALHILDPAYESLEKHRKIGTTTRLKQSKASSNEWFDIFPNTLFPALLRELYRTLAPDGHCYVMCDEETSDVLKAWQDPETGTWCRPAEDAGFTWWKRIVWDKRRLGMGYHYRNQHEFIVFLEKGKRKLSDLGMSSVRPYKGIRGKEAYPTEKPVGLLIDLVRQSSVSEELVCDVFCGSGATGEAAIYMGRPFIGCDTSDRAIKESTTRLWRQHGQPVDLADLVPPRTAPELFGAPR